MSSQSNHIEGSDANKQKVSQPVKSKKEDCAAGTSRTDATYACSDATGDVDEFYTHQADTNDKKTRIYEPVRKDYGGKAIGFAGIGSQFDDK
ncbi:hypothetical protein PtrSN002B_008053 [Pyrenophora tritici-repentis]|uniref:Protamine-P1 domain containing protein n=2 Tax=Pyrenophora tritici-repentis TaxID=45151 RepID=A0A2W1D4A3_9PLEO|nr:uncharacterized protein PTRG_09720 [Pyrenophora tritici-repentis Pt-1C-BFP]KAA8617915.1 hypothetical protein PtrV1_09422 [Pyrenophora tritici-repentis]EDU42771.1 predicted protein [Pyrenophora tritici-repentis Pt-1C-BFP]KAF7443127.1 hypothetical protein A1F99_126340 [Pyrenophora tritici-repentis]KAF7568400.1 Protamine-P1 domain containing protein [Pyrenophora tritici-repentis]KAG9377195.1 hypothetical protein A1F94_012795 [Pyrenophora tritici-repentis]